MNTASEATQFKKGQKGGPGRPKGASNKMTRELKEAILQAAENAGGDDGIVGYLTDQAKRCPGQFLGLLGKVLPMQVAGAGDDGDQPISFAINVIGVAPPEYEAEDD